MTKLDAESENNPDHSPLEFKIRLNYYMHHERELDNWTKIVMQSNIENRS